MWLGFFLPSFLQSRQSSSPYASATTFQESLRRISESRPSTSPSIPGPQAAAKGRTSRRRPSGVAARRRDVLAGLSGLVILSSLLAVSIKGIAVWAPVPAVMVLVGYVVVLRTRVVGARRARPAVVPAPPAVLVPVADDRIVPSVRRRALADGPPPVAAEAPSEHLERIAG